MNIKCAAYKILFWFKQQQVARIFFKGEQRFQVLEKNVTKIGTVINIQGNQVDGDWTFGIRCDDGFEFHCEITPCEREILHSQFGILKEGMKIQVTGDHCFDPPHAGTRGGGNEIHPVREIFFV